jgi:hypothetical protein
VAGVPDQHDRVAAGSEPARFGMNLCHERAGRVDHVQAAAAGLGTYRRRYSVRGEHHGGAFGHLVQFSDEHHAATGKLPDDVRVMDDLLADVHRGATLLQHAFDDLDGALDPGAE